MSTSKKRTLVLLLIPAALLFLLIWYLWPRSFWDALPGYPPTEEVTACYAILVPTDPANGPGSQAVDFAPGSQEYGQLVELLESSTYCRGLFDLFRLGRASDTQAITLAPYTVSVYFRQGADQWSMDFWGPRAVASNNTGASPPRTDSRSSRRWRSLSPPAPGNPMADVIQFAIIFVNTTIWS